VKEAQGDLFEQVCDAVVIPTNGVVLRGGAAVMGLGVALRALQTWPGIGFTLGRLLRERGNNVHVIFGGSPARPTRVVSFPTKHDWRDPSDLRLIARSAGQLVQSADVCGWTRICLPRVGCGAGGLMWHDVKATLAPILDDRFVVVSRESPA